MIDLPINLHINLPVDLPIDIDQVKGFLDPREGALLHDLALQQARHGLVVEIGSYCGKSTVYLGAACQKAGGLMIAVDHHRGSEENQPGQEYFDPDLLDGSGMSSLSAFRDTLRLAGLEDTVIPIVAPSDLAAQIIHQPLAMVFIDGGHSMPAALTDYRRWAPKLSCGGILAIHDVFPNIKDGGRPPHEIYKMALHSGLFVEQAGVKSLRILYRL